MSDPVQTGNPNPTQELTQTWLQLSLRMLRFYQVCDGASGRLIAFMLVFGPWAFGTTQFWSIRVMNGLAYVLGLLLFAKLGVRALTGYQSPRWGGKSRRAQRLTRALAALTVLIPGYCLVSALNPRSTYLRTQAMFEYHQSIGWLPHSYDDVSTWRVFWVYLALALFFWAVRDWLLGKTPAEERAERLPADLAPSGSKTALPERLKQLLWVVTINGGLLGLEGIVQRLSGTGKLLFLVQARVNTTAESQFGPYSYRSNATEYFNLLWPVSLGLWWNLRVTAQNGLSSVRRAWRAREPLLLACVGIMAACPIISASRAGALVDIANLAAAAVILWPARNRDAGDESRSLLPAVLALAVGLGVLLGWKTLAPRFGATALREGFAVRDTMYELAGNMADDYPVFGTGPGTFEPLFQMYRVDPDEYWPAQLHNDWLETRITFGWVGCGLIGLALVAVLVRWFLPGGIQPEPRFVMLIWVALGGCLFHARYDYPFQVYSILSLFMAVGAILFSVSSTEGR